MRFFKSANKNLKFSYTSGIKRYLIDVVNIRRLKTGSIQRKILNNELAYILRNFV